MVRSSRFDPAKALAIAASVVPWAWLSTGCGSATDPRPASWSYISAAIMQPSCATVSCHSQAAAVSGLDFSTPDRGFISLTGLWIWIVDPLGTPASGCRMRDGTVVCQREHRSLVVPFDPAQSRLVHMLRADGAPRMPPDRVLAEADIRLIEEWILAGATETDSAATPPEIDAGADVAPDDAGVDDGSPSDGPALDGTAGDETPVEEGTPDGGAGDAQPQDAGTGS